MTLIENLTLLGDRVIILLDKAQDHTKTEHGILIPLNELAETDGGKITTRTSSKMYLSKGTVLSLSATSKEKLPELNVNDRVYVTETANSPSYQFFPNRDRLVQDFEGYICIPHVLIEAKINTND